MFSPRIHTTLRHLILATAAMTTASCIEVDRASHIPIVHITTPDGEAITSRDRWTKNCTVRVFDSEGNLVYKSIFDKVKARGNSTYDKPKKPYAIKLDDPAPLLGMPTSKRWVLLANFMDHSLLRNSLALAVARQTNLEHTPESRIADVTLNGRWQGCYLLCERIGSGPQWSDVKDGHGYLIEIDSHPDDGNRFVTRHRHLPVNIKYPKKADLKQLTRIEADLNEIERALSGSPETYPETLYGKLIDPESFADWWIVHELTQNAEPNGPRSCFMHKEGDGLLKAGPVWDFDIAFAPVWVDSKRELRPARMDVLGGVLLTIDSLYNSQALWYDRLLADSTFRATVKTRWNTLKPRMQSLSDRIDEWCSQISASAKADEQLWRGKDKARFDTCETFESSAENLKQTYLRRIESLDRILQAW